MDALYSPYVHTCICMCYVFVCMYDQLCELINHLGVNSILSVNKSDITENSATLISKLPCSSPELLCVVSHLATNNVDINMDIDVDVNVTTTAGYVSDPEVTYDYPAHIITVNRLNSSTTYDYCIMVVNSTNTTDMPPVGKPMCGNFTTTITTKSDECKYITRL